MSNYRRVVSEHPPTANFRSEILRGLVLRSETCGFPLKFRKQPENSMALKTVSPGET